MLGEQNEQDKGNLQEEVLFQVLSRRGALPFLFKELNVSSADSFNTISAAMSET